MPTVKPFAIECCQCGRELVYFTCRECREPVCEDCATRNDDGFVICKQHERDRWKETEDKTEDVD